MLVVSAEPASGEVVRVTVDRIACTGHGVCAALLAGIRLDPEGYPIVEDDRVTRNGAAAAVRLCPARALYLRGG